MFEENYLALALSEKHDDHEGLDSLVEFIEGNEDKERKIKNKKRRLRQKHKKNDRHESPVLQEEECLANCDEDVLVSAGLVDQNENQAVMDKQIEKPLFENIQIPINNNLKNENQSLELDQIKFGSKYQKIKAALDHKEMLLNRNKVSLSKMIDIKSKEMKDLLVNMSKVEDESCAQEKKVNAIDDEIDDLEARIAKMKVEKQCINDEKEIATCTLKKLDTTKVKLEKYIEMEMVKAKDREVELKLEIDALKEESIGLRNRRDNERLDNAKYIDDPKQKLLDYLTISISEKEKDLECPVCLETATLPIYSCQENHLICSTCRPMVKLCPECRMEYGAEKVLRRHRYAEKTVFELERMKEEKEKVLKS